MIYFDHHGERYHLRHDNDDDSRSVVRCDDPNFEAVLKFDSSLNIYGPSGLVVGRLRSVASAGGHVWALVRSDGSVTDLHIPVSNYDWGSLIDAEVEAFKELIECT